MKFTGEQINKADVILLVFDVTDNSSFESVT